MTGCCVSCKGTGASVDIETGGRCWDCLGTGCAHDKPCYERRRFRVQWRESRVSAAGKHAFSIGARFGYWPCLKAPFVAIDFGTRRLEIWHGLPSYRKEAIG